MIKLEIDIINNLGEKLEAKTLNEAVFDGKVNDDSIHMAILSYLANNRRGCAKTKNKGEVSGGGIKPWRQKGTGRARIGSNTSPLWKRGGTAFGPSPRDYSKKTSKNFKRLAVVSAVNLKLKEGKIRVMDEFKLDTPRTKDALAILKNLRLLNEKLLIVLPESSESLRRAFRNIEMVEITTASQLCVYDIMMAENLLFCSETFSLLEGRLKQ